MIVASRRRHINIPGSLEIVVPPLESGTAAKLFDSLVQTADLDNSARELVDLLGGHPLAISQAAVYMKSTATTCSELLQKYKKDQLQMFDVSDPRINRAYRLSLPLLSIKAQRLIECMAFMDPNEIPEEIFVQDLKGATIIEKYVTASTLR